MKTPCGIGARVALVAQHWLRPYETGIIVDQQRQALKKWLVRFEYGYPGGGIDGDKIWCDESDFSEVTQARSNAVRRARAGEEFAGGDEAPAPWGRAANGAEMPTA